MVSPTHVRLVWAIALAAATATAAADCGAGCGGSLSGTPADEFVAERMGLVREWVVQIPFDSARANMEHVTVGDGLVVAQTGDGGVHAVKATARRQPGEPAAGALLWSRRLDTGGGVWTPPGVGPRLVTATRDLELFALDRDTGVTRWTRPLGRLPGTGAVEIGDWVYEPLAGGGIRRLTTNPLQPTADPTAPTPAQPAKGGKRGPKAAKQKQPDIAKPTVESLRPRTFDSSGPVARPVRPLGKGVVWATTDGVLVALQEAELDWVRYEFGLNAPAVDAPVTRGKSVFAATQAADLARVDLLESGGTGLRTGWHVVLDATPDAGPFLGGDTVVVSLGETGMAAFSADTGAERWRNAIAGRVLAVAGDRVWIVDRTGRLAGIDLATGQRRERVCLAGFSFPVVNTETDRLVLASPDGVLVSLAPRRPAAAAPREPPPAQPPAKEPPPAEDAEAAEEAPPAEAA
jgi:outer membrane protein assembly factor BamB